MVRINLIKPQYLADQHLLAEHNEILMLMGYVLQNPVMDGTEPTKYKLGKGHIKFFRDKATYLKHRFAQIQHEMFLRGYSPVAEFPDWDNIPHSLCNDYIPTDEDISIIIPRLREKLNQKLDWYTYEGELLDANGWEYILKEAKEK